VELNVIEKATLLNNLRCKKYPDIPKENGCTIDRLAKEYDKGNREVCFMLDLLMGSMYGMNPKDYCGFLLGKLYFNPIIFEEVVDKKLMYWKEQENG